MADLDKGMIPTAKSIQGYLTLKESQMFYIPSFQRAYSWGRLQCEKLLEDLLDYFENKREGNDAYFFGNVITVEEKNNNSLSNESSSTKIQLIDGQQRTTTFLLLLKALHFLLNDFKQIENDLNSSSVRKVDKWLEKILMILYKIDSNSITNYELKNFTRCFDADSELADEFLILKSESMNELDCATKDWNNILRCSKYNDFVPEEIPNKRKDNKYTGFYKNISFFYNSLKTEIKKSNRTSVEQIEFLSLFIQTLLEECKLIQIASVNINQAVAVFNSLNATGLPLSDADVICSLAYSHCDESSKNLFHDKWHELISNIEEGLNGYFSLNTVLQQFMYYQRFKKQGKTDITTPGLRYYYTNDNKTCIENPIEFCANLNVIANMWQELIGNYPLIRLALKINNNSHLFLATFFYHIIINRVSNDSNGLVDFDYASIIKPISELFLRLFTLLELVDFSYSSSEFKVFLYEMGDEFVKLDEQLSFDEIEKKFNANIFSIIQKSIKNLKSKLYEYRGDKLIYLNEYLYCEEYGKDFYFDIDPNRINIEHILPQSMHNILEPMRNLSEEEYDDYIEKLGNKILLERNINNNVSDDNFKVKKASSINSKPRGRRSKELGYKDSCYNIASDLCGYSRDVWVSEDIDRATKKSVERIYRFIVNPLDDSQKSLLVTE